MRNDCGTTEDYAPAQTLSILRTDPCKGDPGPKQVLVSESDPGGSGSTIWIRPSDGRIFVRVGGGWEDRGTVKGDKGDRGDDGAPGPERPEGQPGDVNTSQMNDAIAAAIAGTSGNTNGVGLLDTSGISDPIQLMVAEKINELLTAQRR